MQDDPARLYYEARRDLRTLESKLDDLIKQIVELAPKSEARLELLREFFLVQGQRWRLRRDIKKHIGALDKELYPGGHVMRLGSGDDVPDPIE